MERQLIREGVKVWRGIVPDGDEFASRVGECELVFVLGGDGTILHAANISAAHNVPIVGVDFGRFGFLAELSREEALDKVTAFVNKEHWLEERAMLQAELIRNGQTVGQFRALNDIVVGRSFLSGVIDVQLKIDDEYVTTYISDGLIISTATGSTAYNLATGGPVLTPNMRVMVISAIAPHLSHLGHLVVPRSSTITLYVGTRKGASVTIDGQPDFQIEDKDVLNVTVSPHTALFARIQPRTYFYKSLANRLRRGG
jgi:NAD+ kinase